jgi:hypothetical protein
MRLPECVLRRGPLADMQHPPGSRLTLLVNDRGFARGRNESHARPFVDIKGARHTLSALISANQYHRSAA